MRTLKFRAWNKREKSWVSSFFVTQDGRAVTEGQSGIQSIEFDDSNIVIEQATGLKDRKGADIYEGDVVRHTAIIDGYSIHKVIFKKGCFVVGGNGYTLEQAILSAWDTRRMKVIGNIHESPELLK